MTPFSAYQVIHTWCEQNEQLKRSLNFFCGNEYFKHVIDGKIDFNNFKAKKFWTLIVFLKLYFSFNRRAVML